MGIMDWINGMLQRGAQSANPSQRSPILPAVITGAHSARELMSLCIDGDLDTLSGYYGVQVKLDGIRSGFKDSRVFTREGNPMNCASQCVPSLLRLEAALGGKWFIDGEYLSTDFDTTNSEFKRGQGQGIFFVFDAVPADAWERNDFSLCGTWVNRMARLAAAYAQVEDKSHIGLMTNYVLGPVDIRRIAERLFSQRWEGLVLKDTDSLYARGRNPAWRRIKEIRTHDLPVIDLHVKGDEFKAIVVRGPYGGKPVRITQGFDQSEAGVIKTLMDGGRLPVVECRYNVKAGSDEPRHMVFSRLRLDKSKEVL